MKKKKISSVFYFHFTQWNKSSSKNEFLFLSSFECYNKYSCFVYEEKLERNFMKVFFHLR